MKFQGKIDLWFWILMLGGEALLISALFEADGRIIILGTLLFYSLLVLPFFFRNYVEITEEQLTVAFGFGKYSISLSEITEVYQTHNPISSTAASLDRIVIKGRGTELMCAVRDKEGMFSYLIEKNPDIHISTEKKTYGSPKLEKGILIFSMLVFAGVGLLLMTGNIKIHFGETSFTIEASYWMDKEVDYEKIDRMEYRDEKIAGSRTGGFGSFRLLMGNFKNEEFGNYTRYTYKNCDAGIVLMVNGKELVISGKDKEETRVIYEELMKRCGK